MTDADVASVDASMKLNGRITRDGWVEAAKALVA
jgi:small subunit ribosomal protein S2